MGAGLHAPEGLPINEQVGNYVLRRYLTQGGMAALFLGHHVDGREVVVTKRVLPQFSRDLSFTRMFTREAHLASLLRHPNIIEVYDAGGLETEGCYFVMEYLHGVDVTRFLSVLRDRNLAMPLDHALTIALGMCAGLHYAHEMSGADGLPLEIVHRDVSPSNVMVAYDGQIKVMDFGVAKALALTSFTEVGTRKGKLSYMPPEQARADVLDRRADVFAIGAVLYELTTMRRLFPGANELAVIHQLMYEARTPPSTVVPGYPAALEAIVLKAVEHNAADRFATARELGHALEDFASQAGLTISTAALGAFLREQITPPPHPAEDPEFFGGEMQGAMPDAATAVRPVGIQDTSVEPYSAGAGLGTGVGLERRAPGPMTTAPYVAAPGAGAVVGATPYVRGPAPPRASGLSAPARVGIVGAAILTLAASGGVALLLTRGEPDAPMDTVAPASAASAPAQQNPRPEPEPEPEPEIVFIPDDASPSESPLGADSTDVPVSDTAPAADASRPVKKKKKKASSDAPDPVDAPTAVPAEPVVKKKKRSPTDTLLPILPD